MSATVEALTPGFAMRGLDVLDLSVVHPPREYSFTSPTTTRVAAESGTDGTLSTAPSVPEPVSLLRVGTGLLLGAGAAG